MLEAMCSRIQFEAIRVAFVKDKFEACEGFVRLCLEAGNRSRAAEGSASCRGRTARLPRSGHPGKMARGQPVLSWERGPPRPGRGARHSTTAMGASKLTLEAFRTIEQFRSCSLANPAARPAARHSREESGARIRQQIQELRRELNSCYNRVHLEEIHPDSPVHAKPGVLIRRIRKREQQLLKLFRQLVPEIPCRNLQEETPGSLEEIQAALPPDSQLLEYYLTEGSVLACLLDRKGLRFFPGLSRAKRVEHLLRLLRFQMSKLSLGDRLPSLAERLQADALDHLRQLYRELVGPLAGHLTGRLVIVPHGFLHCLPFHALYDGRQHLVERHAISYAPSATLFRDCALRRRQPAAYSLVLEVGGPATPHIPLEAEQVERLLPHACVLRGTAATAECLRTLGERARFLHIASHGIFRADHPLFSAIQLGDGWLTLLDVYNLRLNCELATLSGCGTGRSLVLAGDEWVGLGRGFLFAGAASLLASLWDINDETTALLMSHFYRELGSGAGQAEALGRAQAAVRERHAHPFYWAPFVLIGKAA